VAGTWALFNHLILLDLKGIRMLGQTAHIDDNRYDRMKLWQPE
jgi:hypothetical protein